MTAIDWSEVATKLAEVGRSVRQVLRQGQGTADAQQVLGFKGGDTIFHIDKVAEDRLHAAFAAWPDRLKPILLYGEGLEEDGSLVGAAAETPKLAILIDPIDGTRNLMYDKRAAWFIAAAAPWAGHRPTTNDIRASVLIELPPSKAGFADSFLQSEGQALIAQRETLHDGTSQRWAPKASQAETLDFGFAQVSNFFPGTKLLASGLMEHIAGNVSTSLRIGESLIFEDQYLSSAGQFVELMCGHDRFCCDLRPLFHRIKAKEDPAFRSGVECHPYDIGGLRLAEAAGVILTDGFGEPLQAPFDCSTGIHWCGYANQHIRDLVEPHIQFWLSEKLAQH